MEKCGISLSEHFLIVQKEHPSEIISDLTILLNEIVVSGKLVRHKIAIGGITKKLGQSISQTNVTGDSVKFLDEFANSIFKQKLLTTGLVGMIISEEDTEPTISTGKYTIAMDPCDGSSNIDCNVPVGTIFAIWNSTNIENKNLVCAGYILYGPSCLFVYSMGHGVNVFTYDPSIGEFILSQANLKFPNYSTCYSINESYSNHCSDGIRKMVEWMKTPDKEGHRPYTSRYVGSLVSDFHRNLLYGGIYIYPTNKLRLLYECIPLSFIAEQAGGLGSNGKMNILNMKISHWHQKRRYILATKRTWKWHKHFLVQILN